MSQYQLNLAAIVDWHQFIEDCSVQYGVPIDTVFKIAMDIFVMQKQMEQRQ